MIQKIFIANPQFIKAIKETIAAKKERHNKIFSQISVAASITLKKMNTPA